MPGDVPGGSHGIVSAQRIELVGFTLEDLRSSFERALDRLECTMARDETELIAWAIELSTSTAPK